MIEYLVGVDGGGTGTRVRLAGRDGRELTTGRSGPSGLALGIASAWDAVDTALREAFAALGIAAIPHARCAIGLGMAGVHNQQWAAAFEAANPGYAAVALATDGLTTLLGAHRGQPGSVIACGTGSVGNSILPDGRALEVSGWGFPSGDEASGAWMGLRMLNHIQKVLDGRCRGGDFASAVIAACGADRQGVQRWLASASQTTFASLAPIAVAHAGSDDTARSILVEAGIEVARMARALDPQGELPLALCGGLGEALRPYVPAEWAARIVAPHGDAASGALLLIARQMDGQRG